MPEHGIRGRDRRRRPVTTQLRHTEPVAANLLAGDFSAEAPDRKWVGDISYIDTDEGLLHPTDRGGQYAAPIGNSWQTITSRSA